MNATPRFKRWLIRIVNAILALVLAVVVVGLLVLAYPKLGRMHQFDPIEAETWLGGNSYTLEKTQREDGNIEVALRNDDTAERMILLENYPASTYPPSYMVFSHQNKAYLVTQVMDVGNNGAFLFSVYSISGDEVQRLMAADGNPQAGASCVYPRLDDDALEFELAQNCETYPLFAQGQVVYTVALN